MLSVLVRRSIVVAVLLLACTAASAAPRDIPPGPDDDVIETLPARISLGASTPEAAAASAKKWIQLSRQEAEPRYLGRAQAALAPWWDKPDAPPALAVLQATVQQSRHEFAAARKVLESALQRDPSQAQGWLTLATLDRLGGHYDAASESCNKVTATGASLYGTACRMETASLRGGQVEARQGFERLALRVADSGTQAWLLSLLAESEERAGRDVQAARAYEASLAADADGYTALAYADLLLRTGKPQEAIKVLARQPAADATLLRRGYAYKQMGDDRWKAIAAELRERFAALDTRGEDRAPHSRERALGSLWLDGDAAAAAEFAQLNLGLQKEPLDWWLALHTAQQAGRKADLVALREALAATGLKDARLDKLRATTP